MNINTLFFLGALTIFSSCNGQGQKLLNKEAEITAKWLVGDTVSHIDGEIRGIFQDSKNNLWFASNGNGVFKYDGNTIVNFTEKHGLSSNYGWMVKEGKDGNIWFKTNVQPEAICCFNGYEFKTIQPDTNVITYDFKNGDLLFGYYFDGKSLSKIQLPHTSPLKEKHKGHYDIYSTCIDRNGNVWFGTQGAGVCKYDGKTFTWLDNMELGAAVRDIYEDKNGIIWIGNNGYGLFSYDGKTVTNFTKENKLEKPELLKSYASKEGTLARVWKITEDNQGNLWVATLDNGVWMYDGQKIINYTSKDGLSTDGQKIFNYTSKDGLFTLVEWIWTIYTDKSGNLWVGTVGDGVYTFDGKKFNKFKP
jgi:ligand-binding sensor domain-containing protein